MIRKYFIAFLLLLSTFASAIAQDEGNSEKMEKIRAIKVGFITDRLHLNSDQSAKFWPVYDAYQQERRTMRRATLDKYQAAHQGATRDQARASLEGDLDYQAKELELKRKYKDRLLQVISSQQLNQLYEAEREFKKLLVDQLKNAK